MSKIPNNEISTNYYYGSYLNYKAFKEFHYINKIDDSYLTPGHCMLLAFMVEKFQKDLKMPHLIKNGLRYVLMNTNFIKDNLIYLSVKERTIKYYISTFKKVGIIDVEIMNKNNRFVNINNELLNLYPKRHWSMTPINYLIKNYPDLWKSFVNDYEPYFNSKEDFKRFVDDFNCNREIDELSYNSKEIYGHLLNSVRYKIFGAGNKRGLKVGN